MKLNKIQVNNYRQLNEVELFFQEDITVLAGPNNSGKTTFISLIKGILSDSKLKYTHNDIPVSEVTKWKKAVFPVFVKCFSTSKEAEQVIEDIIKEISCDGVLKPEYTIESCEIKIQITYDQKNDDIRNFAEYIMDLDESQHSFYFIYTFLFNLLSFKKLLLQSYDKIYTRFASYSEKEDEQKSNIIKDLLIEIYSNSLVESCFFADSNYENRSKIEIPDFKKLFNFKSINAARQLDDTDTDSSKTLSKSIVSLASKDKNWKDTTKALPDSLLTNIQDSGVKEKVRQASVETLGSTLKSLLMNDYPRVYDCAKKIADYLASKAQWDYNNEELMYLMLHVNRLCKDDDSCHPVLAADSV